MKRPREKLEGCKLDGGWTVGRRVRQMSGGTGGVFSEGYIVTDRSGSAAFLKAIDFYDAGFAPDPARALQPLIESFNFERDLLTQCREKNLDRVVRYIDEGKIMLDGHAVQYLILELAERDIRGEMDVASVDLTWQLRMLHHVATGMRQLHSQRIAHQDLKPSNILVFDDKVCKVGDLGRAAHPDYSPPHDEDENPGDKAYAPPELLYRHTLPDWKRRRFGADLYLLGSMIVFTFTSASMTSLIQKELEYFHHWKIWKGSYEQVLPFIRDAFGRALLKVKPEIPVQIRSEIMIMVRQLCEPDPALRGHPLNRGVPYELERYLNQLAILVRKAEMKLF